MSISASHNNKTVAYDDDFSFYNGGDSTADTVEAPVMARAVGAAFLTGTSNVSVFHVDAEGDVRSFFVAGPTVMETTRRIDDVKNGDTAVLCGEKPPSPEFAGMIARRIPSVRLAVCPLSEFLAPFGRVVARTMLEGYERPHRDLFYRPVECESGADVQKFEENLNNDGIGRMAHLIQSGTPVINGMMDTPCQSAFYGRVLGVFGLENPIFLMTADTADKYFPAEPISARRYAASWVPISVANTNEFASASGWQGDDVFIFVASDYIPGSTTFLRFVHIMSGIEFVASTPLYDFSTPDEIPLFRYDGAYNISKGEYERLCQA